MSTNPALTAQNQPNNPHKKSYNPYQIEQLILQRIEVHGSTSSTTTAASEIDTNCTFDSLGLTSYEVVAITGDLEEALGIEVSATLAWEYPSIRSMAEFLATAKT